MNRYPINMIFGVVEDLDELYNTNDSDHFYGFETGSKNTNWKKTEPN